MHRETAENIDSKERRRVHDQHGWFTSLPDGRGEGGVRVWLTPGSDQRRRVHENHDWFASLSDWKGVGLGAGSEQRLSTYENHDLISWVSITRNASMLTGLADFTCGVDGFHDARHGRSSQHARALGKIQHFELVTPGVILGGQRLFLWPPLPPAPCM